MTTTDNFTEAARAEAERQNPVPPTYDPEGPSQWERLLAQQAFRNGAEWARTHLAAEARKAQADAWDEGYMEATNGNDDPLTNPYRYEREGRHGQR